MNCKIISDSSSDLYELTGCAYSAVPLKIVTDQREYVDDINLDVGGMIDDLLRYSGASRSSCPGPGEWKESFSDSDAVFCVTITSGLSGSYNSAEVALKEYLTEHPEKKGCVIDSLSTGPENALIIEKLRELINEGLEFSEIERRVREYQKSTHLIFALESLKNLANNGRVSRTTAKLAGILGIRIIGKASNEGTLEITDKARGAKRATSDIFKNMLKNGYDGGRVRIHHCRNEAAARAVEEQIRKKFPTASVVMRETGALCSFYAESGGVLVGFEGDKKTD